MNKKILFLVFVLMGAGIVYGQDSKQKVAIYTDDKSGKNYAGFAGEFLTNSIVKRGIYNAYERTADFLQLLSKEQGYQRSGAVSENEIAKLGAQLGVQMVCAVKIDIMDGQPFISAKLIDVESSGIKGTARPVRFTIGDFDGFEGACEKVASSLFGERGSRTGAVSGGSSATGSNLSFTVNGVTFEMIFVQGGSFTMGCTSEQGGECKSDEKPAHQVSVSDYYIGKFEVTQMLWRAVMGSNPSNWKGDNLPVEMVSWNDCQDFIRELSRLTGRQFRLPTEAEWEYAARGGSKTTYAKYAGGHSLYNVGWFTDNSGGRTQPVGGKLPNELGIYDMSGNVWEWCSDWYSSGYYAGSPVMNPQGASSASSRVLRGGGWGTDAANCRVANRYGNTPTSRYNGYGFRLVLVP